MIPPPVIEELRNALAKREDGLRTASVPTDVEPLALVRAGAASFGTVAYVNGAGEMRMGGLGTAWRANAAGSGRFEALSSALPTVEPIDPNAKLMVGYAFSPDGATQREWDGFPNAALVLPTISIVDDGGGRRLVVAIAPGARVDDALDVLRHLQAPPEQYLVESGDHEVESHPTTMIWREEVASAVAAIRAGAMNKAVLARSIHIRSEVLPRAFDVIGHLESEYPDCYVFGWQSGEATFVGASPELLVSRRGSSVVTHPHAGSAPRGMSDDEDHAIAESLMASPKNRDEHALVVEDVAARLGRFTDELSVPSQPSLRTMATVQHLATTIRGTLAVPDASVVELAGALHPTPAVGGTPRSEALAFIDKVEGIDRGWYAGGIGWMSLQGDGDIAISIRSALLRDRLAILYAGNGIVADSDPESELAETRMKFRPLLSLLTRA